MQEDFKRIMALIDFSTVSIHAAEEAAILASKFNSGLHLLHVSQQKAFPRPSWPGISFFQHGEINEEKSCRLNKYKLEKIKINLENRFGLHAITHEEKGPLKEVINRYIQTHQINLVVVGARKKPGLKEIIFGSLAASIIRMTESEVLCVYPESNCSNLKKIVIPVGKFIPKKKIRLAYELARKFAANVHIISIGNPGENSNALIGTYQYIRDLTNIPIECKSVGGNNIAEATIHYAELTGADLILVNPGAESRLSGFGDKKNREIINHCSIPVLSVHPVINK